MKITEEQIDLLRSFTCERLSECLHSNQYIYQIISKRGNGLVEYLRKHGCQEDLAGNTAFYIIRNKEDFPLAFFSLKCGLLFAPSLIDSVEEDVAFKQWLISELNKSDSEKDIQNTEFFEYLKNLAVKNNCTVRQMIKLMKKYAEARKEKALIYKKQYHNDEDTEKDKPIYRVHVTYPGIEISHFCINDQARQFWKQQKIHHPMGEVLFWRFIVPKLRRVQQTAGCQYAYLFAADSSEDRTLVNYYNVALKFEKPEGIGTSKPLYDFCCELLIQEINKLNAFQKKYFENFNIDPDVEIV